MALCSCANIYGNTGLTNCQTVFGVARDFWLAPTFGSDNLKNSIKSTDTLDQAFFLGEFNANDRNDRIYPINGVEQYDPTKGETKFFTFDSGTKQRTAEGVRSFAFFINAAEATYIRNLEQSGCGDLSVYLKDADNNIAGNGKLTTDLLPFRIAKDSLDVIYQYAKDDGQPVGIMVTFDLDKSEFDRDIAVISESALAADVDFEVKALEGLLDINGVITNIIATACDANLTFDYGSHFSKEPFISGIQADFNIFNVTTGLVVVITGMDVTDAANGNYTAITYAAQTAADVLRLSIEPATKNGFELDVEFIAA